MPLAISMPSKACQLHHAEPCWDMTHPTFKNAVAMPRRPVRRPSPELFHIIEGSCLGQRPVMSGKQEKKVGKVSKISSFYGNNVARPYVVLNKDGQVDKSRVAAPRINDALIGECPQVLVAIRPLMSECCVPIT